MLGGSRLQWRDTSGILIPGYRAGRKLMLNLGKKVPMLVSGPGRRKGRAQGKTQRQNHEAGRLFEVKLRERLVLGCELTLQEKIHQGERLARRAGVWGQSCSMAGTDHGKVNTLWKLRVRKDRCGPPGRSRDLGSYSQTKTSSGGTYPLDSPGNTP